MDGAGVELHPEDDVASRAPELLVITLQLCGVGWGGQRVKGQATGVLLTRLIESQGSPQTQEREVTNTKQDVKALWETSRTEEEGNSLELWGMSPRMFLHTGRYGEGTMALNYRKPV